MIGRRAFLLGIGGVGIAGAAFGAFSLSSDTGAHAWISQVVTDHLAEGGLRGSGIDRFATDFLEARPPSYTVRGYATLERLLGDRVPLSAAQANSVADVKRQIITAYLVNSDMFVPGRGNGAPVEYLGLSERICTGANPFARFLDAPSPTTTGAA